MNFKDYCKNVLSEGLWGGYASEESQRHSRRRISELNHEISDLRENYKKETDQNIKKKIREKIKKLKETIQIWKPSPRKRPSAGPGIMPVWIGGKRVR